MGRMSSVLHGPTADGFLQGLTDEFQAFYKPLWAKAKPSTRPCGRNSGSSYKALRTISKAPTRPEGRVPSLLQGLTDVFQTFHKTLRTNVQDLTDESGAFYKTLRTKAKPPTRLHGRNPGLLQDPRDEYLASHEQLHFKRPSEAFWSGARTTFLSTSKLFGK